MKDIMFMIIGNSTNHPYTAIPELNKNRKILAYYIDKNINELDGECRNMTIIRNALGDLGL